MSSDRFPGRPEELFLASRELGRQAGRLTAHSRSASSAGAQAVRGWRGSASVAHAGRSFEHVKVSTSGARTLGQAGRDAATFGRELSRIQRLAGTALTKRGQLQRDLAQLLHDRPAELAAVGPSGRQAYDNEIARVRRAISYQEGVINGLHKDLVRLRKSFKDSLIRMVPPEIYQWWLDADGTRDAVTAAGTMITTGRASKTMVQAVNQHKAAVAAGDPKRAAEALRRMAVARKTLAQPGDIAAAQRRARQAMRSPAAQKVLTSPPARRIIDSKTITALRDSPITKVGRRVILPVGVADTVYSGYQDVRDGDGHQGARGVITRTAGGAAMVGAPLMFFPPTAVAGAVLVGGWMLWKGGNAVWDKRQSISRLLSRAEPLKVTGTLKGPLPPKRPQPPPARATPQQTGDAARRLAELHRRQQPPEARNIRQVRLPEELTVTAPTPAPASATPASPPPAPAPAQPPVGPPLVGATR